MHTAQLTLRKESEADFSKQAGEHAKLELKRYTEEDTMKPTEEEHFCDGSPERDRGGMLGHKHLALG